MGDKKNILMLGATGPTGQLAIQIALERGHNVIVVKGELNNTTTLFPLLPKVDTIISVLGPDSVLKKGPLPDFYNRLLIQLRTLPNPPWILAMSTISIYEPSDSFTFMRWFLVSIVWALAHGAWKTIHGIADVFREEGKDVPWTQWRVALLTDGKGSGEVKAGEVGKGGWGFKMDKADVALWLIEEAEKGVADSQWVGKFPALYSVGKKEL